MKILGVLLALLMALNPVGAFAQTTLQAPSIKWAGTYQVPGPVSIISYDTISGLPCIAGSTATCPLTGSGSSGSVVVTEVTPGVNATDLGKAEDAVHGTGDVGIEVLARQSDCQSGSAGTAGDYATFNTDALGRLCVIHPAGASTDISGTVTAGGSYQTVLASSTTRKGCLIQNPTTATEVLNVKIGTMAAPYTIAPGGTISCFSGTVVASDTVTVSAATTGHAFAGTAQ